MDGPQLVDSSNSVQSIQESASFVAMRPTDTSGYLTGQLFMTSGILIVWTMLILFGLIVTVISILLVYKSKKRRNKNLNPLEGIGTSKSPTYNGHESGYSGELTPPNSINIGNCAPITKRIKVSSSYASLTSDSSSEEEFPEGRRKSQISMTHELTVGPKGTVRAFPVQPLAREGSSRSSTSSITSNNSRLSYQSSCKPPGHSVATSSTLGKDEKKPQLTISMAISSEPNLVKVTLIKCDHLKRSIEPKESTFRRVVRARGLSSGFLPLGIFARVYCISDTKNGALISRNSSTHSSIGPGVNGKWSRSTSTDSDGGHSQHRSLVPVLETPLIKSRKGSFIKFNESVDCCEVSVNDFPLRISLYEVDKNKVKIQLGHAIVDYLTSLSHVSSLNQIVLNVRLYETVLDAIKANQEQNKD